MSMTYAISSDLTDEEAYLFAILQDHSGLDLMEFASWDGSSDDGCFRAWPFQVTWWRNRSPFQIDMAARAVGKSLSILARMFSFPFRHPDQEAVITAPELIHLEPIIGLIENQFFSTRLGREMLRVGRSAVTHRPFAMQFRNGARIMGRIPQKDGKGVKGLHPLQLEMDECFPAGTLVLAKQGLVPIEAIEVGDEVLTHRRRWRRVTATMTRERPTVTVKGQGHPGLVASFNHKFFAAETIKGAHVQEGDRLVSHRPVVRPKSWIPAQDMEANCWTSPTVFPQVKHIPSFRSPGTNGKIPCKQDDPQFFWMVGHWIAEGSYSPAAHQVTFSIHEDELDVVQWHLRQLGLTSYPIDVGDHALNVLVCNTVLGEWLHKHCGKGAKNKAIAPWMLGLQRKYRRALLEGLVFGDGFEDPDVRYTAGRWKLTTASKPLAIATRLLALSLDYSVSMYYNDTADKEVFIRGKQVFSDGWYHVVGNAEGHGFVHDHLRYTTVKKVTPTGRTELLYDLTVDDDHSFVADGFCVSNCQDYPRRGWTELQPTLKRGFEGAEWRAHGVTRGVRDKFYEYTQEKPGSPWKVHRITAMMRPNWTDAERQDSIQQYGGHRDDPDYRRNILGLHGDATNPLFVVARLYTCVDDDESSDYNSHEYVHLEISDLMVDELGPDGDVTDLLLFPDSHRKYETTWCGMDVGYTHDPSEILVWGEYHPDVEERKAMANRKKACPKIGLSRFKLLARISLKRVPNLKQVRIILGIIAFYQPKAFGLDKTGVGLPLYQDLLGIIREEGDFSAQAQAAADIIKGYNFAAKVIVDIDDTVEVDEVDGDQIRDAGIHRNVLEQSTDALRGYVDTERLWLPWDSQLLAEFEGQTFSYSKSAIDQFGRARRVFSEGRFHALDAARMFAMAHSQQAIEAIVGAKNENEAVIARFFQPGL